MDKFVSALVFVSVVKLGVSTPYYLPLNYAASFLQPAHYHHHHSFVNTPFLYLNPYNSLEPHFSRNIVDPNLSGVGLVEDFDIPKPLIKAALNYIEAKDYPDDVCKSIVITFMSTLLEGGSVKEGTAAIEKTYADQVLRTGSSQATGACKAAEKAYLNALALKTNPLKAAMTDFIYNSGSPKIDDPCGQAAKAFFDVSAQGASYEDVLTEATRVFVKAFNLLKSEDNWYDNACADTALVYLKSSGSEGLGSFLTRSGL